MQEKINYKIYLCFICVKKDSEINPSSDKYRKLYNIAIIGIQFDDYWQLFLF